MPTSEKTLADGKWRYSINYGPNGEENYAFVYDADGWLVSNLKTHHAIAVVEAMNRRAYTTALTGDAAGVSDTLNELARSKDRMIDNAAVACQVDFDSVTREAIELNVIAPLILAISERDQAITALLAADEQRARDISRLTVERDEAREAAAWHESNWLKERDLKVQAIEIHQRAEAAIVEKDKALEQLTRGFDAGLELAQYASYSEIVGGIGHNREAIRKWCDAVFAVHHEREKEIWDRLEAEDAAKRARGGE